MRLKGRELFRRPINRVPFTIGRSPTNNLVLDNQAVSREHVSIDYDGWAFRAADPGSSNGFTIDGTEVEFATLHHGARLQVGKFQVEFRLDGGVPPDHLESDCTRPSFDMPMPTLMVDLETFRHQHLAPMMEAREAAQAQVVRRSRILWATAAVGVLSLLMLIVG